MNIYIAECVITTASHLCPPSSPHSWMPYCKIASTRLPTQQSSHQANLYLKVCHFTTSRYMTLNDTSKESEEYAMKRNVTDV
ncbi:hypothetical protein C0J52_23879 [Blattella germanica]|nr:hypothetical protein C0J52_23879 [Blattella germanica]